MRICIAYYGNHKKGCWKRLRLFIEELISDDHDITLLLSTYPKDLSCLDQIKISHIPVFTQNVNKASLLYFIVLASVHICLKGMGKRYEKFIAFDCHNSLVFLLPKLLQGTNLVLFIRGFYRYQDFFLSNYSVIRYLMAFLNKVGYLSADRVFFVSNASRRDIIREFGPPNGYNKVIKNNIINMHNCEKSISQVTRQSFTDVVVGYLGQIVHRKNVAFLINVIKQCDSSRIKLVIQGDGVDTQLLENYVKKKGVVDRVFFKNWDSNVSDFFSIIDVFVLPALYDDASNALIEAIAAEKIVFASSRGGNIELLQNNPEFLFCPIQGELDLCRKLERVLSDMEYRNYLICHVKKFKEALQFDWLDEMKRAALLK